MRRERSAQARRLGAKSEAASEARPICSREGGRRGRRRIRREGDGNRKVPERKKKRKENNQEGGGRPAERGR